MRAGGRQHFDGARRCRTATQASVFLDRTHPWCRVLALRMRFPTWASINCGRSIVLTIRLEARSFISRLKDNCLARWHNSSRGSRWQD